MTPAFVITGFLGSGKTTLLINAAREHFFNKRVALIVNELGEVGVDGKVLKNAYSEVLELPEGCICCSLHGEFEKALREIREKYNPEVLLVETSGGAVPFPILVSLQSLGCSVEAVICLIDSVNFERYKEDSTAKYQIGGSNVFVLNKTDLVDSSKLDLLEREVLSIWELYRPINSFTGEPYYKKVSIYKTSYGRLPQEVFSGIYTVDELKFLGEPPHGHNHRQEVINLIEPVDYDALVKKLKGLPQEVIRVKGIVRFKDIPFPLLVNYTFGYVDISSEVYNYDGPSFLVFIKKEV
ncbi:MAG: GTP-binding protein [Acidobacteria bacterium]|jgi:G3E family GTPase|nr:MAG: GTP-binding protein [Acidobacteriota bacterium]